MSKRKAKFGKRQKAKRLRKIGTSQAAQPRFEIEKGLPIVGTSITYGLERAPVLSDLAYQVINPDTGQKRDVRISQELLSRVSEAKALLHFGFGYPLDSRRIESSWPKQWYYLTEEFQSEIEQLGLHVVSRKYLLTDNLPIESFGNHFYFQTNAEGFVDAWIDIIWHEYILEFELQEFQERHRQRRSSVSIQRSNGLVLQDAEEWIPLENCAIRIRAVWDKLIENVASFYFFGQRPSPKEWKAGASRMLNGKQEKFYKLFLRAVKDMYAGSLKDLRDILIHRLGHRPGGVIPPRNLDNLRLALPDTIDGLYTLIRDEHSRVREAIILMAAIILAKTPSNKNPQEDFAAKL